MKILYCLFLFTFSSVSFCFSQYSATSVVHIGKIPAEGILLDKGWKFQTGDNPEYAKPEYDDRAWQSINPTLDIHDSLRRIPRLGICWFRLHLSVDSPISHQLALMIYQSGASELYLNDHLIAHFGVLSINPGEIRAYDPWGKPVLFPVNNKANQVLAVRYALQPRILYTNISPDGNSALFIQVNTLENSIEQYSQTFSSGLSVLEIFRVGVFFILAILHLAFFLFYPSQKANLYFFLFALFMCASQMTGLGMHVPEVEYKFYYYNLAVDLLIFSYFFMLTALYILLAKKRGWVFWALTTSIIISILSEALSYTWGQFISGVVLPWLISLEITRIAFKSIRLKKRGGWILLGGAIGFMVFTVAYFIAIVFGFYQIVIVSNFTILNLGFNFATLSIPVATSIYLGLDFAFTNRSLKQKLSEVENLSKKTIEQEIEKQQILATQNITLEKQVTERTAALSQSLKELNDTQIQLIQSEKMASLGELTAGIAHEIQNPLNFVNNFSEVNAELIEELQNELKTGHTEDAFSISTDIKENEKKIIHHGKRADAIVKGMLQHSRISTGQKEPTDINALADEYLRLSYHGMRAKDKSFNATMKTDFDESIGNMNIVPQDIGRVLLNLFNNAFYSVNEKKKRIGEGYEPTISICTKKSDSKIEIHIKDNGIGIPQKVIDKIYQPFFTTKPTGQGTGLGLSLSYDIVKAHGGEINVNTREGDFTEFVVHLPV